MTVLSAKIKNWQKTNSDYLEKNKDRFIGLKKLTPESSAEIYDKWKQRFKNLVAKDALVKKAQKLIEVANLYEDAIQYGYKGNLATTNKKKLEEFKKKVQVKKQKKNVNIVFPTNDDIFDKQKEERKKELGKINKVRDEKLAERLDNFLKNKPSKEDIEEELRSRENIKVISSKEEKVLNNEIHRQVIEVEPFKLTDLSANRIGEFIMDTSNKVYNKYKNYKGGIKMIIRVLFYAKTPGQQDFDEANQISRVIRTTSEVDEDTIQISLQYILSKQVANEDYSSYFHNIDILIVPLPTEGGCSDCNKQTVHRKIQQAIKKGHSVNITVYNHPSKNNNCAFTSFNIAFETKANIVKPDSIRKALGIHLNTMIDLDTLDDILDYYNNKFPEKKKGLVVINQEGTVIKCINYHQSSEDDIVFEEPDFNFNDYVKIYLANHHYYSFEVKSKKKCPDCGVEYTNYHNRCDVQKVSYLQRKSKDKKAVNVKKRKQQDELDYEKDMCFWDTETFPNPENNSHMVYASGIDTDGKYIEFYGQDSMEKTMNLFVSFEHKTISAYNGSKFDFYFLLNKLIDREVTVSSFIISNGRLLSFEFGKGNKVFDLCLFLNASLASVCKDLNIKNAKSSFDHNKMKCWEDTEKYKLEVQPYLHLDVQALKESFIVFNKEVLRLTTNNVTSFVTLSHMGYEIWSDIDIKAGGLYIEVPDKEKYKFIKDGTYGARCYPIVREFKSSNYDKVVAGEMNYEQLKASNDFIFNADASSLYPASMHHENVQYPVGKSHWSENPKIDFDNNKLGMYDISFIPPRDIRVPILPRKENLSLIWSLEPGRGVYTSVDIKNAINAGYKITFNDKALVWDKSGDIFKNYITKFYDMKNQAEKEDKPVMKAVAKLLLNSLYGKQLQKAIEEESTIVSNVFQLTEFCEGKTITDFNFINNERLMITGAKLDKEETIKKPSQNGAFILAYSRTIMLKYMKAIDSTLKSNVFTYTDTDSLHIRGEHYHKLMSMNMIKPKNEATLGILCSDIKNEGLIIREINIGPKSYMYEYIDNKNTLHLDENSTMKNKGVPHNCLKPELYDGKSHQVEYTSLRKKHQKLSKKDLEKGVQNFSIVTVDCKKVVNKTSFSGMILRDGQWYPRGYAF